MPPKRKLDDMLFDSEGSNADSTSSSEDEEELNDADVEDYYYESISKDAAGRNIYETSFVSVVVPASPSKAAVVYPSCDGRNKDTWLYDFMDNDWTFPVEEQQQESEEDTEEPPASSGSSNESEAPIPKKCQPYKPLKKWKVKYYWSWLNEMLRTEGRGDHVGHPLCVCGHLSCKRGHAEFRCKDCHGCEGFSAECTVRDHARNPLHRIQRWDWDAECFDNVSLKSLGLRFFPGRELHPDRICPHPKRAPGKNFVVMDGYGLHELDLYYCACGKGSSFAVTAATFNVMCQYHVLSLESKCSMGKFYNSLARQTNNVGEPPAIWRNLQMLKRAGRCHETNSIETTKPGACTLECPACSHPGKNLPPDWKDVHRGPYHNVPSEKQFLYALFLALDANFRMQWKDVSSESADADLGNGLVFFDEVVGYMKHLKDNWDQPQPKSTCVAHDAVNTPDKEVRRTASSGIATVDCARHNMKRPKAVGDLQQGERYLNMDWMFFKGIEGTLLQLFFVSYDIACQWHKNIWDRMQSYPWELRQENSKRFFVFLVPKFHLPAHIESCNIKFSFLLMRYVGQTDGEVPERGWANINPLAMSTREMGPHLRWEVLDDHFNYWNWKKILAMGVFMYDRIRDYVPATVQTRCKTLEQERALPVETVAEWKEGVIAWEADPRAVNLFEQTTQHITIASVRYKLVQEGGGVVQENTDSAELLAQGVQLEDTECLLKHDQDATRDHPTISQKRIMLERCSKTRRKILAWIDRRPAAEKRAEASGLEPVQGDLVQDIPLLFPSGLEANTAYIPELQRVEFCLREGQAHEALHEMCHQLLVRTHKYKYKDGIEEHISQATATYQVARKALEVLGPRLGKMEWVSVLQVLYKDDVRQMPEGTFCRLDGSAADADHNPAMNKALRIEWARTHVRGLCNTEEVDLLEEEMRRTPVYLHWRVDWWESQKTHTSREQHPDLLEDKRQREGHDVYATRQARILRRITERFDKKWSTIPALLVAGRAEVKEAEAVAIAREGETGSALGGREDEDAIEMEGEEGSGSGSDDSGGDAGESDGHGSSEHSR
ncbi:hypothetical protein DFH09DRAFT_1329751 [Mycena vulgaris]|nr:hypothetical protein DFH09DRAFT_1329751 [Mycena vulgaris]